MKRGMAVVVLFVLVAMLWAQSNSITLCDQNSTATCITITAPSGGLSNGTYNLSFTGNVGTLVTASGGSGPWSTSGSTVYYTGGSVGVGTSSLTATLESASANNGQSTPQFQVDSTATNSTIALNNTATSGRNYMLSSSSGAAAVASAFKVVDITASANRLVINSSGDIGLGNAITTNAMAGDVLTILHGGSVGFFTSSPGYDIEIAGGSSYKGLVFTSTSSSSLGRVMWYNGSGFQSEVQGNPSGALDIFANGNSGTPVASFSSSGCTGVACGGGGVTFTGVSVNNEGGSTGISGSVIITFSNIDYDASSMYSGGTFTIPVTGKYQINFSGYNSCSPVTGTGAFLYKNGSTILHQLYLYSGESNAGYSVNLSLSASDNLQFYGTGGSGCTVNNARASIYLIH